MGDIQILQKLLKGDMLIPLASSYDKYKVTLAEPQCADSFVEISGIPQNTLVLKVDQFPAPSNLFKGNKGECKRADYAIISDYNGKKRTLFIELKKTKSDKKNIIQQLKGAVCVLKYYQEIGKQFWDEPDFLYDFEFRFISFGHTAIRKRRTRIDKSNASHNIPENMMKIDWPANIRFNHLAGA